MARSGNSFQTNDEEDQIDLGSCCACGKQDKTVRNFVMLDQETPKENFGKGWGCLVCGIPFNGATVVLCDACVKLVKVKDAADKRLRNVIVGWPKENKRVPLNSYPKIHFDHNMEFHAEDQLY